MRTTFAPILVLLLFVINGCASGGKEAPALEADLFPESRFLTAEGTGETELEARREALAALSGIFESKVHAETTSRARSAIGTGGDEVFEKQVESRVAVVSTVQLTGAKIGRVWRLETGAAPYHALAVLDRNQAGRKWAAELATVQALVAAELKTLEQTSGRVQRLAALNKVLAGLLREQALESRLRVLNYPARAMLDADMDKIATELIQLRSEVRLFIELYGDGHASATARIADKLTTNGFLLSAERHSADAVITGSIKTRPLELNNPRAKFVRATATVKVIETDTGATLANVIADVRKAHVDPNEAQRNAIRQVADTLAERLTAAIGFSAPAGMQ
ncbi:MAG: hypothetical protein [Olavius algarvensis Delta 4 endosymbiont]|nr:MAG: hypothetical protein [Olavius algarvensis Delta 4 endosymbiont]